MPRGGDYAARVRAARCYADMSKTDFGQELGVSSRQVGRFEAGERIPDPGMREKIADLCEVPRLFMEMGFLPMEQPLSAAEQRILEAEDSLARQITALQVADAATKTELQRLARAIEALGKGNPPAERPGDDR